MEHYYDGIINGVYFCYIALQDVYGIHTNPSFNLNYTSCNGQQRWQLKFGSTTWACRMAGATGATLAIGMLETTGTSTTDRNIDVRFSSLNLQNTNSTTWYSFSTPSTNIAPNYTYAFVSSTAFDIYLAPLD